jgi:hypothetical protein
MPKLNVTQSLRKLDGSELAGPEGKPLPVRWALVEALLAPDKDASASTKLDRFLLATRVQKCDEVELTTEEASACKECLYRTYPSPLVPGQIDMMLEGKL